LEKVLRGFAHCIVKTKHESLQFGRYNGGFVKYAGPQISPLFIQNIAIAPQAEFAQQIHRIRSHLHGNTIVIYTAQNLFGDTIVRDQIGIFKQLGMSLTNQNNGMDEHRTPKIQQAKKMLAEQFAGNTIASGDSL
jgi:hypothetical protein